MRILNLSTFGASGTGGTPVSPVRRRPSRAGVLAVLSLLAAAPAGDAPLYSNDFAKLAPGKLPEDQFLVLSGNFEVKDLEGDRVLELGGAPLDSFGLLFGPTPEQAAGSVSAKIWAETRGKRVPEFGVGSNDTGGYKLWLMPRKNLVAIRKADQVVATAPYNAWKPQTWTRFNLNVAKATEGDGWVVRGKVWADGTEEPKDWTVSFNEPDEPSPGRASLWANTYSGTPVRFDDVAVKK